VIGGAKKSFAPRKGTKGKNVQSLQREKMDEGKREEHTGVRKKKRNCPGKKFWENKG